jgi:hypothetical protein
MNCEERSDGCIRFFPDNKATEILYNPTLHKVLISGELSSLDLWELNNQVRIREIIARRKELSISDINKK